jgi:ParB family chromosome partitioning protein
MTTDTPVPALVHLDPRDLAAHPANVRTSLDDIDSLAASIRQVGVLEPLVVVPLDEGGHRILAGHRRAAAAIQADLALVPCIERADLADSDQHIAMLVENIRRQNLPTSKKPALTSSSSTSA